MSFEHILAVVASAADRALEGSIVKKILMSILINKVHTEKHILSFFNSAKSAGGVQAQLPKGGSNLLRMKILTYLRSGGARDHACSPLS